MSVPVPPPAVDATPADVMRRAAALMRERAEMASDGGAPWRIGERGGCDCCERVLLGDGAPFPFIDDRYTGHIASWHPVVALAVADWLDACALVVTAAPDATKAHAERVARAYLGDAA